MSWHDPNYFMRYLYDINPLSESKGMWLEYSLQTGQYLPMHGEIERVLGDLAPADRTNAKG